MKIHLFIVLAAMTLATSSFAAERTFTERFRYDRDTTELFRPNEFSLDLFGAYRSSQSRVSSISTRSLRSGSWGGGVGVNYFFTRYLGVGADTHWVDWDGAFIDTANASFIARYPIENIHLAPYAFVGAGGWFETRDAWTAHAGGGLEFRLNQHFGLFAD